MPLLFWILRLYPPVWRERYEAEMTALLEQHHITLWTMLDLLLGALDARLDPNYRRAQHLLPLKRFKSSWRLLVAGFAAFWIALLPWFWMSQIGIDDAQCGNWGSGYALCVLRKMVGAHQPALPAVLIALILIFLPILLMIFMTMLVVARGKQARTHLQLAMAVTGAMLLLCITCGFWLGGIWQLLPQISQFYPQTPTALLIGIAGMALATMLALGGLVRAMSALKAMSKAAPKQEAPISSAAVLSSSTSDNQQADRYAEASNPEAWSAEESQGKPRELPMVLRAATPVREEPAASLAKGRTRKASKVEWMLLVGLVLLFIVPWPGLISGDLPDHLTLLFSWLLAVMVGLITAWLVKEPGKKWQQRVRQKPRRPISPMWWAAILPIPAVTFFLIGRGNTIGSGSVWLSFLLFAAIVSGATALIVKIRMNHPRIKSPKGVGLGIMVLATLFIVLQLIHIGFPPLQHFLFLFSLVSIVPAFFVRVPGRKQQVAGTSEQQNIGAGAGPKVVGWSLFILCCNFIYAQVSSAIFLQRGQYPLPPWMGPSEMIIGIVIAICLIPALIVKIKMSDQLRSGRRELAQNDISPKVWILVLPIIFLTFVTEIAYIIQPDFGTFADVFIAWLLTGLAALIMLLTIRLGSRKRMAPLMEQVRIHI